MARRGQGRLQPQSATLQWLKSRPTFCGVDVPCGAGGTSTLLVYERMSAVKPTWAPKVSPYKIRRLYEQDAKGIRDDELLDEVGHGLYARCDSMLLVTSANLGHPLCFICRVEMPHSWDKGFVLECPNCGWSITVGEYQASYKGQTLNGVGALPDLEQFVERYPAAKTYTDKMLLIDRLIHAFHGNLNKQPSRPVASNVIDGNIGQIANLIFTLAYGENSTASATATEQWLERFNRSISRNVDPATGELRPGKRYLYDGIGKQRKPSRGSGRDR
jgi:hypothetical protein